MMISQLLRPNAITCDLKSTGKTDMLTELAELLSTVCEGSDSGTIATALMERERLATTGIGEGVAIPHAKLQNLKTIHVAIGVSRTGVQFDAIDGQPVHIFVALLAPEGSTGDHLKALAGISRVLKDPAFRQKLLQAASKEDIQSAILEEETRKTG